MKKTIIIPLVCILIFSGILPAQVTYSGRIIDQGTKSPLPGVSIICDSLSRGTVSNDEGEFSIMIDAHDPLLQFRLIGYKTQELRVTDTGEILVSLEESVMELGEVVVTNDDYATKLLRLTNQQAAQDSGKTVYCKGFYQRFMRKFDEAAIVHEMFFDASATCYGIQQWNVANARFARVKDSTLGRMLNPTRIAFLLSSELITEKYNPNFPNTINGHEKYKIAVKGFLNKGEPDEIAILYCKPKKKVVPYFEGDVYIRTQSHQLVRYTGRATVFSFGIYSAVVHHYLDIDINFEKDQSGRMNLSWSKFHFYAKYPKSLFSRIEISDDFSLLIYQQHSPKADNLTDCFMIKDDDDFVKTTTYDPAFWKNNEVLKRDNLMQTAIDSFEKKKYFGNFGGK